MQDYNEQVKKAAEYISKKTSFRPKTGVVLGSGLGDYGNSLKDAVCISYSDIPGFPVSTVAGHKGQFVITKDIICMQGRFHFYEGYDMKTVTLPIRVMKLLGIETLILTNASGGINKSFKPGDLMVITDHINLTGTNPLIGKNLDDFGPRFPDMSSCYLKHLDMVLETGAEIGLDLKQGVYCGLTGPSYETPAEIRMLRILGGDAVGMSTVAEAITAAHSGISVIGISCITNMAAGLGNAALSHSEVVEAGNRVKPVFAELLGRIINKL